MNVEVNALALKLVTRVMRLSDALGLTPEAIETGLEQARQAAEQVLPLGTSDIWVSLRRRVQYKEKTTYGSAFTELIRQTAQTTKIYNNLRHGAYSATEGVVTAEQQGGGLFFFFAVQVEEVEKSIKEISLTRRRKEFSPRAWDLLCHALAEHKFFQNRIIVATDDRVHKEVPMEREYAPSLTRSGDRLRFEPVNIHAVQTRLMYHVVARRLR